MPPIPKQIRVNLSVDYLKKKKNLPRGVNQ